MSFDKVNFKPQSRKPNNYAYAAKDDLEVFESLQTTIRKPDSRLGVATVGESFHKLDSRSFRSSLDRLICARATPFGTSAA